MSINNHLDEVHLSSDWRPLADSALRDRILPVLATIVSAVDHSETESHPQPDDRYTYLSDEIGTALYFSYLHRDLPGLCAPDAADRHLQNAIEVVAQLQMQPHLFGGFAGVAWTIAHLTKMAGGAGHGSGDNDGNDGESATDDLQEIDDVLVSHLGRSPWFESYDLISGLAGYGVYALERLPSPGGQALLEQVVTRLDELAEHNELGTTWHTPPELLPEWQRELYPNGYYNLGLAHGVPAVIAVLAGAVDAGICVDNAQPLLAGAIDWLLAQRLPPGGETNFLTMTAPGVDSGTKSRLAWCYGDAGVAVSLLLAARQVGDIRGESEAMSVALSTVERSLDSAGVVDGFLCHGSAGLGHIFNRLWQATGEQRFAAAARIWFDDCLGRFETGGIEGWSNPTDEQPPAGLLTGSVGIGLALLAAVSNQTPDWDRTILTNVPPRSSNQGVEQ